MSSPSCVLVDRKKERKPRTHKTAAYHGTKLCKFFSQGGCVKGDECGYAHDPACLQPPPNLYRTKWCKHILEKGTCELQDCGYAHCEEELRPMFGPRSVHRNDATSSSVTNAVRSNSQTTEGCEVGGRGLSPPALLGSCAILPSVVWYEGRGTSDESSCPTVCWSWSFLPLCWNASLVSRPIAWNQSWEGPVRSSSPLSSTTLKNAKDRDLTSDSISSGTPLASSCDSIEVSSAEDNFCLCQDALKEGADSATEMAGKMARILENVSWRSHTPLTTNFKYGELPSSEGRCGVQQESLQRCADMGLTVKNTFLTFKVTECAQHSRSRSAPARVAF